MPMLSELGKMTAECEKSGKLMNMGLLKTNSEVEKNNRQLQSSTDQVGLKHYEKLVPLGISCKSFL